MYERLPLSYIYITDVFGMREDPITHVTKTHYGTDFGWKENKNPPIQAAFEGTVVLESYDSNLGNYLVLTYKKGNNTIIHRYLHMKERAIVKQGSFIKRGQTIGYMGKTGYTTGEHLHFEYWICPSNYTYNYNDRSKYATDPLKYCFLFDNQDISPSSVLKVRRVVGTPILKDIKKDQLNVVKPYLNCRVDGSIKATILGYIDFGYYNILDKKTNDGYTWYKVDTNKWIADVDNSFEIHLKKDLTTSCDELKKQIEDLQNQIENQKKIIDDLLNNDLGDNYNNFTAERNDNYFIALKKDETIFFPKLK